MNETTENSVQTFEAFDELADVCSDVLFWKTDKDLTITDFNAVIDEHAGFKPDELIGKNLKEIIHPNDMARLQEGIKSKSLEDHFNFRIKANKQFSYLKARAKAIKKDNQLIGYYGICTFETKTILAKKVIKKLQNANRILLDSMTDAVVIINNNERIIIASSEFNRLWGFKNGEIFLAPIEETIEKMHFLLKADQQNISLNFSDNLENIGKTTDVLKFRDGRYIERSSLPYIHNDNLLGRCWYFKDISQQKKLVDDLEKLAFRDSLTSLYNRRWCENKLKQLLISDKSETLSFLYMDLDHFKVINDSCGHIHGDDVLEEISDLLRDTVGQSAYLSRLGGDEFGLILLHKSYAEVLEIAHNIMHSISNYTYQLKEKIFKLGISIGLVIVDEEDDFRSIFIHADEACYISKETGRNKCTVYNADKAEFQKTKTELKWYDAIQKALLKGKFELWCQSINDIKEPSSHYEILLRMRSENNEMFSPALFMESADRFGMIFTIDKKVIELFCKFYQENRPKLKNTLFSINISGHSIGRDEFLPYVLRTLNQYAIDCKNICFEITESEIIKNLDKALVFIEHVRSQGCKISLDDFGKGLTSFSYLKNIPYDYIKIDGQFIRELNEDKINVAIIKSIVYIAEVMGTKTIAEHIETQVQLLKVASLGVDYFQGHYFSEAHEITKLLE